MIRVADIAVLVLVVLATTCGAAAHTVVIQSESPKLTAQRQLRIETVGARPAVVAERSPE